MPARNPYAAPPLPPRTKPPVHWLKVVLVTVIASCFACFAGLAGIAYLGTIDDSGPSSAYPPPQAQRSPQVFLVVPATLGERTIFSHGEFSQGREDLRRVFDREPRFHTTAAMLASYDKAPGGHLVDIAMSPYWPKGHESPATVSQLLGRYAELRPEAKWLAQEPASTGTYGGEAKCGQVETAVICAWGDSESLGMVLFQNSTLDQALKEFPLIREQIERRS
ncbi:hypothetical protein [Catelliglobosispora koreensis]|uniref:hypothetical protein n=1 Tax=Catelliglobosispora koreensis TaxID=129052 RepID=UPI000368DC2C|nr:hypothetical protein [Catelliglobosispora koreensis]